MQQYAYMLHLVRPTFIADATPEERAIIGAHFAHLQRLFTAGTMLHVGRAADGSFGIAVFTAPSDEAATALMESDPVIINGVMTGILYPYRVALHGNARDD